MSSAEETEDALRVARTVADSVLVKTAIAAGDPNWGRIGAAVGRSGVELDPSRFSIQIGEVKIVEEGEIVDGFQEERVAEVMKRQQYDILIGVGDGDCDHTNL